MVLEIAVVFSTDRTLHSPFGFATAISLAAIAISAMASSDNLRRPVFFCPPLKPFAQISPPKLADLKERKHHAYVDSDAFDKH